MKVNKLKDVLPDVLPVIPTMDVVVFPNMIVPLLVLDERIINGINKVLEDDSKLVLLVASSKGSEDQSSIGTKDLYSVGTVASIMRLIKIPEGGIKILVQGLTKVSIQNITSDTDMLKASVKVFEVDSKVDDQQLLAHIKNIKDAAEHISSAGVFSPDFNIILSKMTDPEKIADFILSHLNLKVSEAQQLLEFSNYMDLLSGLYRHLLHELEISEIQESIKINARESMNKSQKEFYLREQLKAIKKELGEDDVEDIEKMREKAEALDLPEDVYAEVMRSLSRLERTSPDSMEASVNRNHIEWVLSMPWGVITEDNLDINKAKDILDKEHHGLAQIKEHILDYISIRHLKKDGFSPILCFVGPPGTGKTSLGKSIANCLGRNYARISLGGVTDEAEIRGHRRTYVGSMPGRFIQAVKKSGSLNPVILIDELDKIGANFRGDPAAAMLEILDPQQNKTFYDNYLGVPFDLSKVIFIATANSPELISGPLRDRMDMIYLSGYTLEEKLHIARNHLVSKALQEAGLNDYALSFSDEVLEHIISSYTKEAGVRELDRLVKKLCSKAARVIVEKKQLIDFTISNIENYLGPKKFIDTDDCNESHVGICNGLAWTALGGEIIRIESVLIPGSGKLILTGSLGDVMKESAQAAVSYAKAHADEFMIPQETFTKYDIHIHVPSGGIPKDGPSAGVTILSSLLSTLTKRPINAEYAMTGELNLRGNVMPIGGVKEKILAAKRNNMAHVILPHKNKNDLVGLEDLAIGIEVIWVNHADEILNRVLMPADKGLPN